MTGITFEAANEAYGKRLQTLKEIAPQLAASRFCGHLATPTLNLPWPLWNRLYPTSE